MKDSIDRGEKPEWSFWSLRKRWNVEKDTLAVGGDGYPWWQENSKEAYSLALESLAKALSNWPKSRKGGPERPKGRIPEA